MFVDMVIGAVVAFGVLGIFTLGSEPAGELDVGKLENRIRSAWGVLTAKNFMVVTERVVSRMGSKEFFEWAQKELQDQADEALGQMQGPKDGLAELMEILQKASRGEGKIKEMKVMKLTPKQAKALKMEEEKDE